MNLLPDGARALLRTAQALRDRSTIADDPRHSGQQRADEQQGKHHHEFGPGNPRSHGETGARLDDARDRLIVMTSHHTRAQTKPRAAPSARSLRIGV